MTVKGWWEGLAPSVRRASVGLAKAFFWSILLIALAYGALWLFAENHGPSVEPKRLGAFIDAVLAGILAFAMLGVFTFLVSMRRPEEEKLDDRVSFLFSARGSESALATGYLRDQVMLLGAIIKHASFGMTLLEVSPDGNFVKVLMKTEMRIVNMMKHDVYKQTMPLTIGLGKLDELTTDLGMVISVTTQSYDRNGVPAPEKSWLKGNSRLTNLRTRFKTDVMLDIPPSGDLVYRYSAEGWNRIEDTYLCRANRFAERLTIEIKNESGMPADCLPYKPEGMESFTLDKPMTVPHDGHESASFAGVPPSHRVAFQISLQYDGPCTEESDMQGIDTTGG